jgi:ABC-2 type transport system permease protein
MKMGVPAAIGQFRLGDRAFGSGVMPVFRKELADHLGSRRFAILFAVIVVAGVLTTYAAGQSIQADLTKQPDQSFVFLRLFTSGSPVGFVSFIAFLGPLMGVAFGFDAINSEQARGTLGRLLSQPIYRDDVINGKFAAGLVVIAITMVCIFLIVAGLGLRMIGVPPTQDEVIRLIFFLGISIIYVGFWLALATLFSLLTKQAATSALGALAVWLFLGILVSLFAGFISGVIYPVNDNSASQQLLDHVQLQTNIARISPASLYSEASSAILTPELRVSGQAQLAEAVLAGQTQGVIPGALSLNQSLLLVWPDLTATVALTVICFGVAYATFLRQEVRTL